MSASKLHRATSALLAASLLAGSTAASAATSAQTVHQISPWAALSVFGTQSSRAAVCGASAASAAAAQGGQPGCVLPAVDAPVVPQAAAQPGVAAPAYLPVAGQAGLPPLLLALAAIATGAFLLAFNLNDDDEDVPISPA